MHNHHVGPTALLVMTDLVIPPSLRAEQRVVRQRSCVAIQHNKPLRQSFSNLRNQPPHPTVIASAATRSAAIQRNESLHQPFLKPTSLIKKSLTTLYHLRCPTSQPNTPNSCSPVIANEITRSATT